MSKLVIVESPTKIKKIQQYLGPDYKVDSCVGHIRDLPSKKSEVPAAIKDKPWAEYAVDVDGDFQPYYVTIHGKGKVLTKLRKELKEADELLLATDEDREGESISWHLVQALKPKVPVKRLVFNEITKEAIHKALEHTRDIDDDLVQAQETRRILDRLYGYALSPLLWKKVGGNLSAGRVQSVALRLVVDRERERRAFVPASYWGLTADLAHGAGGAFDARLLEVAGKRLATGRDFDKETGKLAEGKDVLVLEEPEARRLQEATKAGTWNVLDVQHDSRTTKPKPPFTTSTLQQEANNRLNLSARDTMRVAQRLYEGGLITYMRTDSTHLSEEAMKAAAAAVTAEFGDGYLHAGGRVYRSKSKNAQEAHEAIRPAGEAFQHPDRAGVTGREKDLYRLIWQRTLASQMADERYTSTTARIGAAENTLFVATGKRVDFPGYRAAWNPQGQETQQLPELGVGDAPECRDVAAEGHETKPPARYTEASLVKRLDEEGIGRPSTYASIMDTIQRRGYVTLRGKALVPSFTGFAAIQLLERHFPRLVDTRFTAQMEDKLDDIAGGDAEWVPFLRDFFQGKEGLKAQIDDRMEKIDPAEARSIDLQGLPCAVKLGRFGAYVEIDDDGERVTASLPEGLMPDELTAEEVERILAAKAAGPRVLGEDPDTGKPVYLMDGRYGPYVQLGEQEGTGRGAKKPPRASIPKGQHPDSFPFEEALFLLKLPRILGEHPDGGEVSANQGRFGPYVAHAVPGAAKPEYRSLPDADALRTIDLAGALELLAKPKGGRRGPAVLKELGKHPKDDKPVQLLDGRYGPYVKHGKTNASLPKGTDVESIDMAAAVELIKAKAGKGKK
ncbi:MAG: type I DNA topoisomerase [Thermoplasmatota archaeon]